ncbi:MAG: alginate lyase family protein [Anaerolineales bacterium]|nr:alginate lyase family protein [Anaerolineales bacterium]
MKRFWLAVKAWRELGYESVGLYALYRFGLRSGHYRRMTPDAPRQTILPLSSLDFQPLFPLPDAQKLAEVVGKAGLAQLRAEADEIVGGQVRLFGGDPVPLQLSPPGPIFHWTEYELGRRSTGVEDVKFLWEPARFSWAFTLCRAYHLTGDERYPASFWQYVETFLDANPPYRGPHWISAQEVALRLMAFVFALQVFSRSAHTTANRSERLRRAIAEHAGRIPLTLVYARSQNNNHLLSEAAGVYTAALALPGYPVSDRWRELGWRWFQRGLQAQITEDGAYSQHSANYHRLMLQLGLWVACLARSRGQLYPESSAKRLAASTRWLLSILDSETGRAPNLGPNDGAYILPLAGSGFHDYRPVAQAAAAVFRDQYPIGDGPWDEMVYWLNEEPERKPDSSQQDAHHLEENAAEVSSPLVLRQPSQNSWAYLRAARFTSRPGHADQLHLDLWWRGLNVAQDAGTYLYNAAPPWDNALAQAQVHNTLTVGGLDQMTRAGKFLYLDWAQAFIPAEADYTDLFSIPEDILERRVAWHDGYRRLGAAHWRSAAHTRSGEWVVDDALLPISGLSAGAEVFQACLHWLLPDWPWELATTSGEPGYSLHLSSPLGQVRLDLSSPAPSRLQVARAGENIYGEGAVSPTWGWCSPTYGVKIPALSVRLHMRAELPIRATTRWIFT